MMRKRYWLLTILLLFVFAVAWYADLPHKLKLPGHSVDVDPRRLTEAVEGCRLIHSVTERAECYKEAFGDAVGYGGTAFALETLTSYSQRDREVLTYCHVIVHEIGRATFAKEKNVLRSFSQCSSVCASGCYHGTLEQFLIEKPDFERTIPVLCKEQLGERPDDYTKYQCLHGLGHGFMHYFHHELFVSLKKCDLLKTPWEREACYGGAFMENIVSHSLHPSHFLDVKDLQYPCNVVDTRYKSSCYFSITDWFLKANSYNFKNAFEQCDQVPEEYVGNCYRSMGRSINWSTQHDLAATQKLCDLGSSQNRKFCVMGAVIDFVNTDKKIERASRFCRMVTKEDKPSCYYQLGKLIPVVSQDSDERSRLCEKASEKGYIFSCLTGAKILTRTTGSSPPS